LKQRGIGNISDGSGFNHIADGEPLDCLVFGSASGTIGAADGLDMAAPVLVATVGSSFLNHDCNLSISVKYSTEYLNT